MCGVLVSMQGWFNQILEIILEESMVDVGQKLRGDFGCIKYNMQFLNLICS
jgi:hypothetical protein